MSIPAQQNGVQKEKLSDTEWQRLIDENKYLRRQAEKVADANAHAAEIMAELETTKMELQEKESFLRTLFEILPVGLFLVDEESRCIVDVNAHALNIIATAKDQLVGRCCNSVVCQTAEHACPILDLKQGFDQSEREVLTADGRKVPVLKSVVPVVRDGRKLLVESFVDIAGIKDAEKRIKTTNIELAQAQKRLILAKEEAETAALHDPLTQLPNRRLFHNRLELSLRRAERFRDYTCAVLYLDLDHFKIINDGLGHDLGDELLVEVGSRLQSALRRTDVVTRYTGRADLVARLGGDEFAILLDGIKDTADALRVAERIRTKLVPPIRLRDRELCVTASIGIATSASKYPTAESMLRDADTAMYRAKAAGRGRHVVFDEAMHSRAVERLQLESELRHAIENHEFVLEYQPILSLSDERITGFESLLRWQSPRRGLVGPAAFISVAEESGLIVPIGTWVLRQACSQLRIWQERFASEPVLTASVNLSARQFAQPDLVQTIARILDETGVEGRNIRLELTESVAMQEPERTARMIEELRHLGVRLSIDDFGTGYSSLDYLDRFSVDTLKIDRHFVARMAGDQRSQNIVKTIISLAHNLRISVVAEGPETAEQVSLLTEMNCDCVQGYFFSKPVGADKFESLLHERCQSRA